MAHADGEQTGDVGDFSYVDTAAIGEDRYTDRSGARWDPAIHATGRDGGPVLTAAGTFRARRGSRGSGGSDAPATPRPRPRTTSTARTIPVESYAGVLLNVHTALAAAFATPELVLEDAQAQALAQALADVQAQYGGVIDPRAQAWAQLGIVAASIYVPVAIKVRLRKQAERERARE